MSFSLSPASAIERLPKPTDDQGDQDYRQPKVSEDEAPGLVQHHCSRPLSSIPWALSHDGFDLPGVNPREAGFKGTFAKMIDRRGTAKTTTHLGEGSQESLGKGLNASLYNYEA